MKRFAIMALKGLGWLLLAGLLLLLSWAAFNNKWVDAKPRPVPERLQVRAASVAPEKNVFFGFLGLTTPSSPIEAGQTQWASLSRGEYTASGSKPWDDAGPWRCSADKLVCLDQWAARHEALAVQLQQNRAWGERCAAFAEPGMGFEEPLPDFSISFAKLTSALPPVQNSARCTRWLLAQAVVTAERKQFDETLMRLRQADRLTRMQLVGSNSLISHAVGWANARLQWQTVAALAARHPDWAATQTAELAALLRPLPEEALIPNRWASYEAAFGRAASISIEAGCATPADREKMLELTSRFERWMTCDSGVGFMLNSTVQLGEELWLRILEQSELNAKTAPHAPRFSVASEGGYWHWRNTFGHILYVVAEGAWNGYPRRQADVELFRQTSALALQLARVPVAERAAWLKVQPIDASLRERIRLDGNQLIARSWVEHTENPEFRLPLAPA